MFCHKNVLFLPLCVHAFLPSIFKCCPASQSTLILLQCCECIVYLINTQRYCVPLYFISRIILYRLFQIRGLLILNAFLRPKQHIFHSLCIIFMTSCSLIQINTAPNPEHQMIIKIQQKSGFTFPLWKNTSAQLFMLRCNAIYRKLSLTMI